jgi:hypothetical protein
VAAKTKKPATAAKQQQQQQDAQKQANKEKGNAAELRRQRQQDLAQARKNKSRLLAVSTWLGLRVDYTELDGEAVFEVELPAWLLDRSEFLEELDLCEGKIMLDDDELQEALEAGGQELASIYFGSRDDVSMELDFENLLERAQGETVLLSRAGLPPWYKHMTEPLSPEEVAASLAI